MDTSITRSLCSKNDSQIKISILLILKSFEVMYIIKRNTVESNSAIETLSEWHAVGGNHFFFCLGKCIIHKRYADQSVTQSQSVDTMVERKLNHVWSYFSSTNSQDTVCDVCGKTVRSYGNTTNFVKHLRLNTEYEAFMMRRTEEESTVSGAAVKARQMSPGESFGAAGRHFPGTEEENVDL